MNNEKFNQRDILAIFLIERGISKLQQLICCWFTAKVCLSEAELLLVLCCSLLKLADSCYIVLIAT